MRSCLAVIQCHESSPYKINHRSFTETPVQMLYRFKTSNKEFALKVDGIKASNRKGRRSEREDHVFRKTESQFVSYLKKLSITRRFCTWAAHKVPFQKLSSSLGQSQGKQLITLLHFLIKFRSSIRTQKGVQLRRDTPNKYSFIRLNPKKTEITLFTLLTLNMSSSRTLMKNSANQF